jgi:hypothetical protein
MPSRTKPLGQNPDQIGFKIREVICRHHNNLTDSKLFAIGKEISFLSEEKKTCSFGSGGALVHV